MRNQYVRETLLSLNTQNNPTLDMFFSDNNINVIQKSLIQEVKKKTGHSIGRQSCGEIYTVMKYVYVNNAKMMKDLNKEINLLNNFVLHELIPMVSSNVLQYMQYMKDINSMHKPLDYGTATSIKGQNSLEQKF